jgi:proteic killer suppression protein
MLARKLDILTAATSLNDLRSPGNHLEKLRDELVGYWSIRVNDQYRITFRFEKGTAMDVRCHDIH